MIKISLTRLVVLMLSFGLFSINLVAQTMVSGNVTSEDDNLPLPGVSILKKGSASGVVTDSDGNYSIEANANDVLVFSFVGFQTTEYTVGARTKIDVSLIMDISTLSEIVVMGYSQKTQKELSASVATVSSKELQDITSPNIETMLQGKVAGLTVSSSSGQPGTPADIRIRGITSLDADRPPLFVVDGIIGGNYVPGDVESVTVLKDAAAMGLYGAAGAAGVIIVTTKKGKTGRPQVTYSGRFGVKEAITGNFELMNGSELYEAHRQMWGDNTIGFLNNRPEELEGRNFDWLGAGFGAASIQTHNLSFRGKGEKVTYGFVVDYFNEEGTFIETDFERLNLRGNLDFEISDKFSIATDVNVQSSRSKFGHFSWFEDTFWNLPWDDPRDADGNLKDPDYITNPSNPDVWYGQFKRNFLHSAGLDQLSSAGTDIVWSVRASYDLTDWLTFETRTRLSSFNSTSKEYYSPLANEGRTFNGIVSNSRTEGYGILSTHFLRFAKRFGRHDISAFVAHEGGYFKQRDLLLTGINLSSNTIQVIAGASEIQDWGGSEFVDTGISYISELSYGFSDKYFLTAYFRVDGSSRFAENNQYGSFPGASVAWLLSEESFLSNASALNMLKLRASYGLVGNSNIPRFLSLPTYNITRQYSGQPGGEPNNPANPNLGWETTQMLNIGADLSLFNNSITLNLDVYQKVVEGMLLDNPLAFSTGYEIRTENIGDMRNRGIELIVTYNKSFGKFSYTGSFNASFNKNEITKITDVLDQQQVEANGIRQVHTVGLEAFSWYMPVWMGVNSDTGAPQWELIERDANGNEIGRTVTGDYALASATENLRPSESALPRYVGGFNNSLSYKNLSLSFLFTFQAGNHIYNQTRQFVDTDGANTGINLMKLKDGWSRWEKPGDNATHPELILGGNNGAHNVSTRYLEKGDFVRLRNITLSYSLPDKVLQWAKINNAAISFSADNLMTFTNFSGMDADIGLSRQEYGLPGLSYLKYPISKQFLMGLTINF